MQGGTNLPRVRDYNQSVVLEAVRAGGTSRVEIAEKTGLTAQTVSNIVRRLLDEGLVVESGVVSSGGGKPRVVLRINPEGRYAVGVLLDRDDVSLVVMGLDGGIVARHRQPLQIGYSARQTIAQVAAAVKTLIAQTAVDPSKILGVGVGSPGAMDHFKGIVYEPLDMFDWQGLHLKETLAAEIGYAVSIDNDATVAAIGERWVGGAHARNFAFIFLSVGIGAGLFIENQLYRGSTTNAGEFGHMTLNTEGPLCFCGNRGCIEMYCAPVRMIEAVQRQLSSGSESCLRGTHLRLDVIHRAALDGDAVACGVLQHAAQMLAAGVVSLVNVLDLDLIVLGGKSMHSVGTLYQQEVQTALDKRLLTRNARRVRVELSAAGDDAGAVGAAALILHDAYAPRMAGLRIES